MVKFALAQCGTIISYSLVSNVLSLFFCPDKQ